MAAIIRASGAVEQVQVPEGDATLAFMQAAVGGWIEAVPVLNQAGRFVAMFANEDGRGRGLQYNLMASELAGQTILGDVLVGTRKELGYDDGDE